MPRYLTPAERETQNAIAVGGGTGTSLPIEEEDDETDHAYACCWLDYEIDGRRQRRDSPDQPVISYTKEKTA